MSAVPVGPGTNIGRSCMFLGSLIRTLRCLPAGLARFLPCGIGGAPLYFGWEKCGHGLTSRPRETSEPLFLDSLLGVFGYPSGSGRLLLAGDLPLRYYPGSFALRKPTWKLPRDGGVRALVTDATGTIRRWLGPYTVEFRFAAYLYIQIFEGNAGLVGWIILYDTYGDWDTHRYGQVYCLRLQMASLL